MKTHLETSQDANNNRQWVLIDATGKTVGRLASQIASILRGKTNTRYTPHCDTGHFVVVVNAKDVRFSGKKAEDKKYFYHTGFIGGIKTLSAGELLADNPEKVLTFAVQGMLPKNALGKQQLRKLKIYPGPEHPHGAQQPKGI